MTWKKPVSFYCKIKVIIGTSDMFSLNHHALRNSKSGLAHSCLINVFFAALIYVIMLEAGLYYPKEILLWRSCDTFMECAEVHLESSRTSRIELFCQNS